jgi:hypothetical protein
MNYVDLNLDNTSNGNKFQSWGRNLSNAQRFQIFNSGSDFIITKASINKVMEVDMATSLIRIWDVQSPYADRHKFKFDAKYDT